MIRYLACIGLFLTLLTFTAEAKRVALVIGNNSYTELTRLHKAGNDAQAIKDFLVAREFEVILQLDTDLKTFKQSLFDFSAKIKPGDIAVFYYAGHGAALNGANYLMPVDVPAPQVDLARPEKLTVEEVRREQARLAEFSVKEALVLAEISVGKPKVSLVILDSCRNNPLRVEAAGDSPFRDAATGDIVFGSDTNTSEKKQPEGMIIVYSASFGQQALDVVPGNTDAPNSIFTTALLDNLKKPGLGLKQVIENTREDVYQLAKSVNYSQAPAVYSQLFGGDIFLNGEKTVEPPKPQKDPGEAALAAAGNNPAKLKVVIQSFPGTVWAKLAEAELQEQTAQLALLSKSPAKNGEDVDVSTVTECDRLAAVDNDQSKGIKRVEIQDINIDAAIPACRTALAEFPNETRFMVKLGRALSKAEQFAEAVQLFTRAAESSDANGMVSLGFMYYAGTGVDQSYPEAAKWFLKAAEKGNFQGMNNIGYLYENGFGVEEDKAIAITWYKVAAAAGNKMGMLNLARAFRAGIGVKQNFEEAGKWEHKAEDAD